MRPPRQPMEGATPEFIRFMAAQHDPHFVRAQTCWGDMRREPGNQLMPGWEWIHDAEYCLDRTEAL